VRGAARQLGVSVPVTSPTFTIGQRYPAAGGRGADGRALVISHVDLYRLGSLTDEDPDLLDEYLGPETISFVEWPQGGEDAVSAFAHVAARVRLEHAGGECRRVVFE